MGHDISLSPKRFEHSKKLEKPKKKKKKRGQDLIQRQCWCFFVCVFFFKTFEGAGLGHRKSMSLETHLLTITEQAMQVTHIGSECRGSLGKK